MSPTKTTEPTGSPDRDVPGGQNMSYRSNSLPEGKEQLPEGEEKPPKGVRIAAVVRWMLLLAMAALAASTMWQFWGPGAHTAGPASHAEDRYYCAMHPQIRSPEPGECPICHMSLVPIPESRRHGAASTPAVGSGNGTAASVSADAAAAVPSSSDAPMPGMVMDGGSGAHGASPTAAVASDGGTARAAEVHGVVPVTIPLERQQLVGIAEALVTRRVVGETLRVPGVAEAPQNAIAQVHVRVPGFLERLAVRETGVRVAQGQPLAWMYSPQIYQVEQELLTAHRWTVAPTASGPATSNAPVATNDAEPADMDAAARRSLGLLGLAASDIDQIVRTHTPMRAIPIRAPAAGFVMQREAVLGLYVQPETVLYEIADLSRIWVVASIFERDLQRIHRGTPARFITADAPDAPLVARVDLIEPEVSVTTRTARVRLEIANPGLRLRPGQFGDVVFDLPAASFLLVPRDALIDTGEQQYVYVDAGEGQFEPRRVRPGPLFGDQIEVLDGLREGERIVTRGNFMLDSESRLQASLAEAPAPTAASTQGASNDQTGPNCESEFDRQRFPDRYMQCRACERVHRGMGSMEADCKNAIARPWR